MSVADGVTAVRTATTLAAADHLACVRIGGAGAPDLLDRVSPRPLFVRAGQMLHTVLLDDAATPLADVYLCCDEDDYLIVADGMAGPALVEYLRDRAGGLAVALTELTADHRILSVDGPYAWELIAEVTTPDVIGLPYLGFFHAGGFTCLRAGTTGEYGYALLVARERAGALAARIRELGAGFGLCEVDLEVLDVCGLEAGFWNPRRQERAGLTPVELQLQWRVAPGRDFPGAAVIAARRAEPHGRVTLIASATPIGRDAPVGLDGEPVGAVLDAVHSPIRDEWLAVALLDARFAHPGLGVTVAGAPARTISAPAINNRSLYVDPQRHSWATRAATSFPPLVRPGWS